MNDLYMPFEDRMPMKAAVDKRMNGEALPPPKRASAGFSRIILRACAYSTNERYATIDDMLRELDALEKGAPTTPAPAVPAAPVTPAAPAAVSREPAMPSTSKPPQPAPFPQRNFDSMPVIIAILSLIVIGAAIFFCFKLLKKDDKDKTSSPEQSSMAAEVTEARNQSKISSIVPHLKCFFSTSVTSQNGISLSGIAGPNVWSCLPPETAPVVWPKPPACRDARKLKALLDMNAVGNRLMEFPETRGLSDFFAERCPLCMESVRSVSAMLERFGWR